MNRSSIWICPSWTRLVSWMLYSERFRPALRLHRAWYAQRSHHIPASWGAAPSSGADEEVGGNQRAEESGCQTFFTHHLCHHPDICKVAGEKWKNLFFFGISSTHIQNIFLVRPGWCRRLSWLAYPTPFCTSLSSTGLWWRIRHIRRHWWRTSSRKVAWLTPTCICPQPRTGNCRRWP